MALVNPSRAVIRRTIEVKSAKEAYDRALSYVMEDAPTVDQLKSRCRDAETALAQYMQAIILLKEAQ